MITQNENIAGHSYYSALALFPVMLALIGLRSFTAFHMLVELIFMAVAFSIFVITWNVRKYQDDGFLLFIGVFFLFTGAMDLFNFLSIEESVAPGGLARNMSAQFWIATRVVQSVSFAVSPFFLDRKINFPRAVAVYLAAALLAAACIFWWRIFPACFVEVSGPTYFKIVSECFIVLIFIASIPLLGLKRCRLDTGVFRQLILSAGFFTVSEAVFAPLAGSSGWAPILAHLLKLTGYFFAYRAVIATGLSRPFDLLLRNVKIGENALKKERDFVSAVLDTAGALVIVLDAAGRILRFNKACESATGYVLSEAEGKYIWELFLAPEEAQLFRNFIEQPVVQLGQKSTESWLISKTGKRKLIDWAITVLVNEESEREHVILAGIDITKRRTAEEELKKSVERYRSLYNKTPVMLHSFDSEGRVVSVSEYWLDIMGYESLEVIGCRFVEFLTDASRIYFEEVIFPNVLKTGCCRETGCELLKKSGEKMDVLISIEAERNDSGDIIRSLAVMVDITDRKRAQLEIEELNKSLALRAAEIAEANCQLEKLNNSLEEKLRDEVKKNRNMDFMLIEQSRLAAMGEMIGNIAHQWRQPLNAVSLIIQDLEESYEYGEFSEEYLKASVRQAMDVIAHMSQTINDFRNFFKPNKEVLHFSVKETIQRAINFVAGSLNDCNIRLDVDMENDVFVCGQPNEYSQVILNILNNAREACIGRQVADAKIAVYLDKEGEKSVVTITDNAGGIPEEIIGKVFDPYFSTKESGGTGIGLYMSKTIIEKHMKGCLSVRNSGSGAEFRIEV